MINILLADDMEIPRKTLCLHLAGLKKYKFVIEEAENGKVVMRKLEDKKIDILILDWEMPIMDGLEVLNKISDSVSYDNLSVIINSVHDKNYIRSLIKKSIFDDKRIPSECILNKPTIEKLRLAIEATI